MAVSNYNTTLREWENLIRVNLKVTNPALLKSGALGILTNYLASIKYDTLQYYGKVFQEMNPGLAQDFNSMLYHASIYGATIQFAQASVLSATLVVPEITLAQVNTLIYKIPKGASFTDTNDIPFIATADIKIEQTQVGINASSYNESRGIRKLSVTKSPNPNVPGRYVFLIHTSDFEQYQKEYATFEVDAPPTVGQSYSFEVGINKLNDIKQVRAWINNGIQFTTSDLVNLDIETLAATRDDVYELNIKFFKFESSNRDKDLFLEMFPNSLVFETGDGIHGAIPSQGSQIITEIQTTRGIEGNIPNSEFLIQNVQVTETWDNKTVKDYTTNVNGLSVVGSIGGESVQSIDNIRDSIFTRMSVRNSIVTENDYENMFQYQGVRPFVDAKFIDAQAFVFLFNVIRDQDTVVDSTALNIKESDLLQNPFYPELDYAGKKLISPFYYKNFSDNRVDAYMVNPQMNLATSIDIRTPDFEEAKKLKPELAITYDFNLNKSFIEIISGALEEYDYYFVSDQFRVYITADNNDNNAPFTYEINKMFTDPYCVLLEPLTGIIVHIKNKQGQVIASYSSDLTYNQLIKKQTFYKYFQEVEEAPGDTSTADTLAYLDNINNDRMTTYNGLTAQVTDINASVREGTDDSFVEKFILRMPFISSNYFFNKSALEMFETFNAYFVMNMTQEYLNYNTLATQTFHNTIDIPPKYYDSIFKRNTMEFTYTPKLPIEIEVYADRIAFMSSKFETQTDFDTSLRIEIIKFLKKKEGFVISFFETDLEKHLYDTFKPLILNVAVKSPTLFQVNSSSEIYRDIEKRLSFEDVLDFTPPYFHYDYENLNLKLSW